MGHYKRKRHAKALDPKQWQGKELCVAIEELEGYEDEDGEFIDWRLFFVGACDGCSLVLNRENLEKLMYSITESDCWWIGRVVRLISDGDRFHLEVLPNLHDWGCICCGDHSTNAFKKSYVECECSHRYPIHSKNQNYDSSQGVQTLRRQREIDAPRRRNRDSGIGA